jgi:hypothetical protein
MDSAAANAEGLTHAQLLQRQDPNPPPEIEPIRFENYSKGQYIRFKLNESSTTPFIYGVISGESHDVDGVVGGKLYPLIFYNNNSIIQTELKEIIVQMQFNGGTLSTCLRYTHNDPDDPSFRTIYNTTKIPNTEVPEDIYPELIDAYNLANGIFVTPVNSSFTTPSNTPYNSRSNSIDYSYFDGGKRYRKKKNRTKRRNKKTKRRNRKSKRR